MHILEFLISELLYALYVFFITYGSCPAEGEIVQLYLNLPVCHSQSVFQTILTYSHYIPAARFQNLTERTSVGFRRVN